MKDFPCQQLIDFYCLFSLRATLHFLLRLHFAFAFNTLQSHNLHHMRVEVKQTNTFFILLLSFAKEYPSYNNIKGHLSIEGKVSNVEKWQQTEMNGVDWWFLLHYFEMWKIWNICYVIMYQISYLQININKCCWKLNFLGVEFMKRKPIL